MADQPGEIDKYFRDRFDGLKDQRVQPASQWAAFEQKLNASQVATTQANASGAANSLNSFWSVAASFTVVVLTSALLTSDQAGLNQVAAPENAIDFAQESLEHAHKEATQSPFSTIEFEHTAQTSTVETIASSSISMAFLTDDLQTVGSDDNLALTIQESRIEGKTVSQDFANSFALNAEELNRAPIELAKMPGLNRNIYARQTIHQRELSDNIPTNAQFRTSTAYVRMGIRTGNGESNCVNAPSEWRLNGLAAIGYTYALNAKTFISAELGYLRRSGNGLERSLDVDLQPLANVLISAYETTSEEELTIRRSLMNIRESLVAENLDYLHMPVAIHVNLNTVSNVSIGAFVDRLVKVENESFMVYNKQDYIRTDFGFNDESTMEGLNKWRVGLIAGYEQSLTKHITIDGRAMLPITSVFDRGSEYYQHAEPNQLVDIQLGLNYKI